MSKLPAILYVDRQDGQLKQETVFAGRFLNWSYNSRTGFFLTHFLLSRQWASWLYGWWHRQSWSRRKIASFIKNMNIDCSELLQPLTSFSSFNDFFIRRIDLSRRKIDNRPGICIAPVDSKVLVYEKIRADRSFPIKRHSFNLTTFLRDENLARRFNGGAMAVCRLHLKDYHHTHFPDNGIADTSYPINGRYYAGGPYAHRRFLPFFAENYRIRTAFHSQSFGEILIVEIGAFTVGSIRQDYQPGQPLRRGDHKGWFELGGSTVVLLFQKNAIRFDADLLANSANGLETQVRMGESIGQKINTKTSYKTTLAKSLGQEISS